MNFSWSKKEKSVARKAFDLAHDKKLQIIINGVKSFKLETWKDLHDLKTFINSQEKETNVSFDFRYSVLIICFSKFIREGLLTIDDLKGLNEEKIEKIKEILNL